MKATIRILPLLLSVALLVPGAVLAQKTVKPKDAPPGAWRLIGTVHANNSRDNDALAVKGPDDDFRRIKFKVTNSPLNMYRMAVVYENGEPDNIEVKQKIAKGGESRVIDLKGKGTRRIRKIQFWYESAGMFNGKADVTVFGQK